MTWQLAAPWLLCALALAIAVLVVRLRRGGAEYGAMPLARMVLRPSRGPLLARALVALGIACLAVALARPQHGQRIEQRTAEGRDLVLVIDLSRSMQVEDLSDEGGRSTDRLAVVCHAAKRFIERRGSDRIGLVFFASHALTSCPLTYDHATVISFIDRTEAQLRRAWASAEARFSRQEAGILGDGTNLGLGLGMALRSLRTNAPAGAATAAPDAKTLGRAAVLITDGRDSQQLQNWVDPLEAARQAAVLGVKVYGIGVGNPNGTFVQQDDFGRMVRARVPRHLLPDLGRLKEIAGLANGLAFDASDANGLDQVFRRIDALEPTRFDMRYASDFADRWRLPLALGLALIALAFAVEPRLRGVA